MKTRKIKLTDLQPTSEAPKVQGGVLIQAGTSACAPVRAGVIATADSA